MNLVLGYDKSGFPWKMWHFRWAEASSLTLRVAGSSPASGAFQPASFQSHPLVLGLSRPHGHCIVALERELE